MLITPTEGWIISSLIDSVKLVAGDIAEVGTYRGASAALIASSDTHKPLHIFDTFEGLPTPSKGDEGAWECAGLYNTGFEEVRSYLSRWPNIRIYKGLFPDTARDLESSRFSFVHLDMDLYEGTFAALEWFYPRMSPRAVLITHDYDCWPGVKKAFGEFFQEKQDLVIELPTNQAFFVKA